MAYICRMLPVLLATSLWQKLDAWDKKLFVVLNGKWTNSFFDTVLPYFRDSVFWAPLYLFALVFIAVNYGKKGWWWSLAFVCTIAIADIVSSRVFKVSFERLRPCQDPFFFDQVRLLLKHCSSSYSFTSSHAANHFGMAAFVSLTLYSTFGRVDIFKFSLGLLYCLCPNLCRCSLSSRCIRWWRNRCFGRIVDGFCF